MIVDKEFHDKFVDEVIMVLESALETLGPDHDIPPALVSAHHQALEEEREEFLALMDARDMDVTSDAHKELLLGPVALSFLQKECRVPIMAFLSMAWMAKVKPEHQERVRQAVEEDPSLLNDHNRIRKLSGLPSNLESYSERIEVVHAVAVSEAGLTYLSGTCVRSEDSPPTVDEWDRQTEWDVEDFSLHGRVPELMGATIKEYVRWEVENATGRAEG